MKKLTTLLIVFFFIANGIDAQTGTIKGIVKDKVTGEPLFGANVYIEIGGNMIGGASDPDGKYTIKPVNVGTHTVYIKMLGYETMKVTNVPISSDKIAYVNVDMENAPVEFGVFKVVGEKEIIYEVPLISIDEPHVKTLMAADLKNDPNIHNPVTMLNRIEGVTVAENGRDVYIRGSRPQSTQFITDGMKSVNGDMGIPGQAIGSVKVYTGGVPAKYGDLTGGVVVVETKSYYDFIKD